jgi:hypothetical protein
MGSGMKKILVFITTFIAIGIVTSNAQILTTSCELYGSISISGEPAADNLPVVAYINGQEYAKCFTVGGQYSLVIIRDNPDTGEKEGWAEGDVIVIKINGTEATPSLMAQAGRIRLDLNITTLSVKLDTWGKIKALFK